MKKILFFVLIILLIVFVGWLIFSTKNNYSRGNSNKISVITTLFPLYDFAKNVGGANADVSLLLPPGVDPHSFEPKAGDVFKMNQSDIFIYTGDFMEPWAKDILGGINNKNLLVVNASNGITMIPGVFHDSDEPAGSMDPHIWLDFDNDKIIINSIANAFIAKDPANKANYEANAAAYDKKLTDLDSEYASVLNTCSSKEVIYGGHYAFGYMAKKYDLNYVAVQGISPDAEPTAQDMAGLVDQIRKDNIKYVFYEELTSPKIAQTIAAETGAKLLLLNPAANVAKSDLDSGISFIDVMKNNLNNLKIGLGCQ